MNQKERINTLRKNQLFQNVDSFVENPFRSIFLRLPSLKFLDRCKNVKKTTKGVFNELVSFKTKQIPHCNSFLFDQHDIMEKCFPLVYILCDFVTAFSLTHNLLLSKLGVFKFPN
jgi:hypothetical protein